MMKNNKITLSIVLPSYQEEENLRILLPRLITTLQSLQTTYEILVVDTSDSMDQTSKVCRQHYVRYIHRRGGNRYGDAVRTGVEDVLGKYVLFMDADGSHTPEFIANLFEFAEQYDIVIASRYIDQGHTENSFILELMSRVLNLTYSLVLNLPCKDVSNSFKIYRSEQLKPLTLQCNSFDIVEEILFKIHHNNPGIMIKEIPYSFKKRMFGETKRSLLLFIFMYIITIIKLRFRR